MLVNPGWKSTVTQIVDRLNFNGFSCSSSKVFPVTSCFILWQHFITWELSGMTPHVNNPRFYLHRNIERKYERITYPGLDKHKQDQATVLLTHSRSSVGFYNNFWVSYKWRHLDLTIALLLSFVKLIILTECTIAGNETKQRSLKADREIGKFQIKLGEK